MQKECTSFLRLCLSLPVCLANLWVAVQARTKFPKYKVDLKHCDDCDPKLTVTFVNGTKVEIDARRKDFEELCRELGPFLRDAVRKDELDGVMREGLDWERD